MIMALILIVGFVCAYCLFLNKNECTILPYVIWGGVCSAVFIGSIGFFVGAVSGNTINGLLASTFYYICNYGAKEKLGVFYLFRMSEGELSGKTWSFVVGILLILGAFLWQSWNRGKLLKLTR